MNTIIELANPLRVVGDEMFDWLTKTELKRIETLPLGFLDFGVMSIAFRLPAGYLGRPVRYPQSPCSDLEAKESAIVRCRAWKTLVSLLAGSARCQRRQNNGS